MRPTADLPSTDPATAVPPGGEAPCWSGAAPGAPDEPLVGRRHDLAELEALTGGPGPALITLVGVGGAGKSRLAAEVAVRALAARGGRVAVVPLDAVSDASLVLPAIAGALGVASEAGRSLADALAADLGRFPSLLVLDTLEHVRAVAPELADLRDRTPGLTILATSRVALGVPRERVVRLEPMGVPRELTGGAVTTADLETVAASPAVELFLQRARAVRPDFELSLANAALVAAICRRLDGIPLLIELAAAALRVLAPHQLLDQLESGLAEPGPDRTGPAGPERQRSLRAAMDWSLGLLGPEAQRLYRRVSVFAGPFSTSAVTSVLDRGERRGLLPLGIGVADGLAELVAASLLRREEDGRSFAMLTTVRADALDRLVASGEAVPMRWAHAYDVLALVEAASLDLPTDREVEALDRLDEAHDDIREALDWATDRGDGAFAVRLAGSLAEFWRARGHHTEGRLRLAAALAVGAEATPRDRRRALAGAGLLASYQGDHAIGESYLREALAVAREEGDDAATAAVLNWLGTNAYGRGDLDAAEAFVSEGLALRRHVGDPAGIALAMNALGGIYHFRGKLDQARDLLREGLALKQGLGNASSIAVSLTNLGLVERDAGRTEEAGEAFAQAIAAWERAGDRQRMAVGLHNAALVALDLHHLDEAAGYLARALAIARQLSDRVEIAYALADLARVEVERGRLGEAAAALREALPRAQAARARIIIPLALEAAASLAAARREDRLAVRLWSAAAAERADSGFANMPADERHLAELMGQVRERLDPAGFAEAWADGAALTTDAAVALAMSTVGSPAAA